MDLVSAWLKGAGKSELLTKAEAITLGRQIQAWKAGTLDEKTGRRALNKMIRHNMRLVAKVWRSYFSYIEAKDPRVSDLLQEGALGLRHAALKFEPERGYTFATYSIAWIRRYMAVFLRDKDRTIRLSADCYAVVNAVNKFTDEYEAEHGKKPTIEQAAAKLKKNVDTVKAFLQAYHTCNTRTSLDQRISSGNKGVEEKTTYGDMVPAPESYDLDLDKRADKIARILDILFEAAGLDEGEQILVRERLLYSDNPRSYRSIAEEIGMKTNAARPHLDRCLKRLNRAAAESGMNVTGILCRA